MGLRRYDGGSPLDSKWALLLNWQGTWACRKKLECVAFQDKPMLGVLPSQWAFQDKSMLGGLPSQWAFQDKPMLGVLPSQWAFQDKPMLGVLPSQWAFQDKPMLGVLPSQWAFQDKPMLGVLPSQWAFQDKLPQERLACLIIQEMDVGVAFRSKVTAWKQE